MVLVLLLACGGPDVAEAFRDGRCAGIADDDLHGQCVVAVVDDAPARADELCPEVRLTKWRDECFFVAVDAVRATGDAARVGCARAGGYTHACHANAIAREVGELDVGAPDFAERVRAIVRSYGAPPSIAEDYLRRRLPSPSTGSGAPARR